MVLWIDAKQRMYGLRADNGYLDQVGDTNSVQYTLDEEISVEAEMRSRNAITNTWSEGNRSADVLPMIRFTPDGFVGMSSPDRIQFRQGVLAFAHPSERVYIQRALKEVQQGDDGLFVGGEGVAKAVVERGTQ